MAPGPQEIGPGLLSLDLKFADFYKHISPYVDTAIRLVRNQHSRLGMLNVPEGSIHCQYLLVDAGQFVHPVISASSNFADRGTTFAAGGQNFTDLYPVSVPFSPEDPTTSVAVDWKDGKQNDYVFFNPVPDKITLENGKLTLVKPDGEKSENFLIDWNFILRLNKLTSKDEKIDYYPVIKAIEAGLLSASGQEILF